MSEADDMPTSGWLRDLEGVYGPAVVELAARWALEEMARALWHLLRQAGAMEQVLEEVAYVCSVPETSAEAEQRWRVAGSLLQRWPREGFARVGDLLQGWVVPNFAAALRSRTPGLSSCVPPQNYGTSAEKVHRALMWALWVKRPDESSTPWARFDAFACALARVAKGRREQALPLAGLLGCSSEEVRAVIEPLVMAWAGSVTDGLVGDGGRDG